MDRNTGLSYVELSQRLSMELDLIGYNKRTTKLKHKEQLMEEFSETFLYGLDCNSCGSCAEGTKLPGTSDSDVMSTVDGVTVIESIDERPPERVQYLMVKGDCKPGFVKLNLKKDGFTVDQQYYYGLHADGNFLSSKRFTEHNKKGKMIQLYGTLNPVEYGRAKVTTSGPAVNCGGIDYVYALKCNVWPKVAVDWLNRQRKNNWPSPELLKHLHKNVRCHVVPTGDDLSRDCDLQWKMSFAAIERELVWSLNDTQVKCFVLMKMLLKNHIAPQLPEEDEIKTYHIKTVVFWLCEELGQDEWVNDNLARCVKKALDKLLKSVTDRNLPQYIVPSNNLLKNRLMDRHTHDCAMQIVGQMSKYSETVLKSFLSGGITHYLNDVCVLDDEIKSIMSYLDHCIHILYIVFVQNEVSKSRLIEYAHEYPKEFNDGKLYVPCIRLAIAIMAYRDIVKERKIVDRELKVKQVVESLGTVCNMDSIAHIIHAALIYIREENYEGARVILDSGVPKHGIKLFVGGDMGTGYIKTPTATPVDHVDESDRVESIETDRHKLMTDIVVTRLDHVPDSIKFESVGKTSHNLIRYHPLVLAHFLRFLSEYHLGLVTERKMSLWLLAGTVMNTKKHCSFCSHINLLGDCYKMIHRREIAFSLFWFSLRQSPVFENAAWYRVACMVHEEIGRAHVTPYSA